MKKSYDSKFKSRVALKALCGELIVTERAGKYQVQPQGSCLQRRKYAGRYSLFCNTVKGCEILWELGVPIWIWEASLPVLSL